MVHLWQMAIILSLVPGGCCPGLPWGRLAALPDGFLLGSGLCVSGPWLGIDEAGMWAAEIFRYTATPRSGQWAVGVLLYTSSLLWAVGSGDRSVHRHIAAWGQWAVELPLNTASLCWGSEQWKSYCTLPHCPGGASSVTPAGHCPTALGQWAVELLLHNASLPLGSGQRNSFCTLPRCLGAVGSGTPSVHCLTAPGQWAVVLLW